MQLKSIIRVELIQKENRDYSNSIHVCYSKSDSVISIKHKLQLVTGIPTDNQILYHATSYLSDSTLIHILSQANHPIPTLHMHVSVKGGAARPRNGFQPFTFKDVTSNDCFESCNFSESSPYYCIIDKGISFEAICTNKLCDSVNNDSRVFISKECPACGQKIPSKNWQNILFNGCTAEITWVLIDGSGGQTTLKTEDGKFIQVKQNKGMKDYHLLDVQLQ
ncbi:hypothetical protein LOD99_5906 [Oopsacas minuta]|uniref:Ubiquitin-like domain-containing protein n=1 Tax=Oopsacas minuta TaxID=111878 RepID=A0AAV7JPT3_9METZ|nr:hypothetical protein LOD99_5906 [Oopsacas minuta]